MKYLFMLMFMSPLAIITPPKDADDVQIKYKHIKPILKERCALCHGPSARNNWLDEKQARSAADKIKTMVELKVMPPGNSTKMTEAERELIIKWVNQGAN